MRTDVITTVTSRGFITQGVQFSSEGTRYMESQETFQVRVIDLMDQQVREALIHLGWTPPPEGFKPRDSVDAQTI